MYFYNKEENKNLKVLEGSFVCLSEIKSNPGAVNSTFWLSMHCGPPGLAPF